MDTTTYALLNKKIKSTTSGITSIQTNADNTAIDFTLNDGSTISLAVTGLHSHSNLTDVLEKFTVVDGRLYFNGVKLSIGDDIDLTQYYTKSETYSKTEVDIKINSIDYSNYYTKSEMNTKLTNINNELDDKVDKVTGKSLISDTLVTDINNHIANTNIHLSDDNKSKLDELSKTISATVDKTTGEKTVKTNGVITVYSSDGGIKSTTIGGVKTAYNPDGSVSTTTINDTNIQTNSDNSISIGDTIISTDTSTGKTKINGNTIGETVTTATDETSGNTTTTTENGGVKTIIEKDSDGNVVSQSATINNIPIQDIVENDSEWATDKDVNDSLSDTYTGLGW